MSVPVTKYSIVEEGLANGFPIFGSDKSVIGVHTYERAPVEFSWTLSVLQIVSSSPASTGGRVLIITSTVSTFVQLLPSVPVTIYAVVTRGQACGLSIVELDKPAVGVQTYETAPVANKFTQSFSQRAVSGPATMIGSTNN
jgi:hypothetical protein